MSARLAVGLMMSASLLPGASAVLVHGHRGARAVLPENTLPAFEYAIEAGVHVLELDLAVTKDNVLVVSHDPHVNPVICKDAPPKLAIRELTLAELKRFDCGALKNPLFPKQKPIPGTRIPTLDEVLSLASKGKFEFNMETKIFAAHPELTPTPEEFASLVLEAVRKRQLVDRVILQSFDFRTLHAMKKLEPAMRLAALYEGTPKPFVAIAREAGAGIVSPRFNLVTKAEVEAAHEAGLQVIPWTPNTPEGWQHMLDCGVDAIITDDPAGLFAFLKRGR
ncbi:MAG TPA: glycerophosphodiester phosphodiesterase [Bryobacteraceae bacterium]|nr:glycerophosphodiester phosphodiesterase [Bryobacteraceae bacterium]